MIDRGVFLEERSASLADLNYRRRTLNDLRFILAGRRDALCNGLVLRVEDATPIILINLRDLRCDDVPDARIPLDDLDQDCNCDDDDLRTAVCDDGDSYYATR